MQTSTPATISKIHQKSSPDNSIRRGIWAAVVARPGEDSGVRRMRNVPGPLGNVYFEGSSAGETTAVAGIRGDHHLERMALGFRLWFRRWLISRDLVGRVLGMRRMERVVAYLLL